MVQKKDYSPNNSLTKIKALFFCLISLVLIFIDQRTTYLEKPKYYLNSLTYPLMMIAKIPNDITSSIENWFVSKDTLKKRIKELENRELYLSYELQKLATVTAENRRLRLLLRSSTTLDHSTNTAELISTAQDPYRHLIILNQGASANIKNHSPILNNNGIIGQIIELSPFSSKAILITDSHHSLPIEINRNGVRGLANGTGKINQLDIKNIPYSDDIEIGDLIVTSGLDGLFPHGFPVATIDTIALDATGYYAKISATPTANLERIREVLIITPEGLPFLEFNDLPPASDTIAQPLTTDNKEAANDTLSHPALTTKDE